MLGVGRRFEAPALTLLILLGSAFAVPESRAALQDGPQEADTLAGTVRTVEEGAGVEIVTGFHLALRVVYVRVDGDTRITVGERPAQLGELEPGQVVRIRLRVGAEGNLAQTIRAVGAEDRGGMP